MTSELVPFQFRREDIPTIGDVFQGPWKLEHEQLEAGAAEVSINGVAFGKDAIYEENVSRSFTLHGQFRRRAMALVIPAAKT